MGVHNPNNIVLTGPPRSGTTLACNLLNKLPNTIALHEPFWPRFLAGLDDEGVRKKLGRFYRKTRRSIRDEGVAPSKTVEGDIPENAYGQAKPGELRPHAIQAGTPMGSLVIDKQIEGGFRLIVKQPAIFPPLLHILIEKFPCYAIVRNPLSILASWNSVDHLVRDGHSAGAELFDEQLAGELASIEDRTSRQLHLLSWWYERIDATLGEDQIIRYEDMVSSRGTALSVITEEAKSLDEPLSSKNRNSVYDHEQMRDLGSRLLETDGAYWRVYSRESVEDVLSGL